MTDQESHETDIRRIGRHLKGRLSENLQRHRSAGRQLRIDLIQKMKDNSLNLDFESESARDITYTFTIENEKLLLVSMEMGKEMTYELTK